MIRNVNIFKSQDLVILTNFCEKIGDIFSTYINSAKSISIFSCGNIFLFTTMTPGHEEKV
jgi:hypothetical protein